VLDGIEFVRECAARTRNTLGFECFFACEPLCLAWLIGNTGMDMTFAKSVNELACKTRLVKAAYLRSLALVDVSLKRRLFCAKVRGYCFILTAPGGEQSWRRSGTLPFHLLTPRSAILGCLHLKWSSSS